MSIAGRKRRTKIGGQFSWKLIEMMESPAFRTLSLSAHRVLDRLEIELAHHGGTENGTLTTTYDDFEKYGIHRHAIGPAIREAAALGFLEVTRQGRAGNAEYRTPSQYRLTYKPTDNDKATDDWRRIDTLEAAVLMASAARLRTGTSGGKRQISVRKPPLKMARAQ